MPSFCRHGRLEANCPICSARREQRQAPTPQPGDALARRGRRLGPRAVARAAAATCACAAMARARRRRLRARALPGLRSSRRRRAPGRRAGLLGRAARRAARRPARASTPRSRSPPTPRRPTWLAFLIAYLSPLEGDGPVGVDRRGAHERGRRGELPMLEDVALGPRTAHDPARGRATLLAYRAWAERAGSQARRSPATRRGPTSAASTAPSSAWRCRASAAPRATSCSCCSAASASPTCARGRCSSAADAARPDGGRRQARASASATRCCCSAARPSSRRRPACRSRRSTSRWPTGRGPRASGSPPARRSAMPAPLRERVGAALGV